MSESRISKTFYKAGEWASSKSAAENEADPVATRRRGAATIGVLGAASVAGLIVAGPPIAHGLDAAYNQMINEVQSDQSPMDAVGEAVHNQSINIAVQPDEMAEVAESVVVHRG